MKMKIKIDHTKSFKRISLPINLFIENDLYEGIDKKNDLEVDTRNNINIKIEVLEPSTLKKYTTIFHISQNSSDKILMIIYTSFTISGIKIFIENESIKLNWKEDKYVY